MKMFLILQTFLLFISEKTKIASVYKTHLHLIWPQQVICCCTVTNFASKKALIISCAQVPWVHFIQELGSKPEMLIKVDSLVKWGILSQINILPWVCIFKLTRISTVKGKTILSHPYSLESGVTFLLLPNVGGQGLIVKDCYVKRSTGNVEHDKCWRQN